MLKALKEFLVAFGQRGDRITVQSVALGSSLISEEHTEFQCEVDRVMGYVLRDETVPVEIMEAYVKELTDLLYVVLWNAARHDIDLEEAFRRVHASNMSKLGPDGKVVKDASGKVLKGPHYHKPDLNDVAYAAMR